jgi:hypothetical protein
MTNSAANEPADPLDRARAAFDARLDRDFGDAYLDTLIASALADAIMCAREEGALDEDAAWSILSFADFEYEDDLLETVLETHAVEELVDLLIAALESVDRELLVQVVGPVEELGGFDSSDFAVMTAGYATTWAIRRNGMVAIFEEGDDSMSSYEIRDRRPEANDPTLRELRLEVGAAYGGLGPGVWIAGADELDDELRAMTMNGGWWSDGWATAIDRQICDSEMEFLGPRRDSSVPAPRITPEIRLDQLVDPYIDGLDQLVDPYIDTFRAASGLDDASARARLRALFLSGEPETNAERLVLWEVWKQLQL